MVLDNLILALLVTLVSCALLPIAHGLVERFVLPRRTHLSPQAVLVKLTLALDAVLMGAMVLAIQDRGEVASCIFYSQIFFNAYAYAYFHVFNLSETGRRIKMLIALESSEGQRAGTDDTYSPGEMIAMRLVRLEQMAQIRLDEMGRYRTCSPVLLSIGGLLRRVGIFLLGKNRIA
jgi:hypothetical protein